MKVLAFLAVVAGMVTVFMWSDITSVYVPEEIEPPRAPKLAEPPEIIKALYVTSWSASSDTTRTYLFDVLERTEANAVVINVKDVTGLVAYDSAIPEVDAWGLEYAIVSDLPELVQELHQKGVYVIARIVVFQDPALAEAHPEWAIHTGAHGSSTAWSADTLWRDRRGGAWIDPAATGAWDYIVALSDEIDRMGFDEINYDYIRFPSDGDVQDTVYPVWNEVTPRREVLRSFFAYLKSSLPEVHVSADVFGILAFRMEDEGIGQVFEDIFGYFDVISPMIYPSHFSTGFNGFENPAAHPYEMIYESMRLSRERLDRHNALQAELRMSTSTEAAALIRPVTDTELRPWLQDFDLGTVYGADEVRAQIQGTEDALGKSYKGYFLWSPENIYTTDGIY